MRNEFVVRPMSPNEAKQEMIKRYGSYEAYREAESSPHVDEPDPKPVEKSKQQQVLEACEYAAKVQGIT